MNLNAPEPDRGPVRGSGPGRTRPPESTGIAPRLPFHSSFMHLISLTAFPDTTYTLLALVQGSLGEIYNTPLACIKPSKLILHNAD